MIVFGEKYRIRKFDNLNLVIEKLCDVEKKNTKEIKQEWLIKGYYGNLSNACKGLSNLILSDGVTSDSFQEFQEFQDYVENYQVGIREDK